MRIKWKHLSSKEKDELIGLAVKALVELSKGEPHAIPANPSARYFVESTDHFDLQWSVCDSECDDPVCLCFSHPTAQKIRDALNAQQ